MPVWISLKTALLATLCTFVLGVLIARWRLNYRGRAGDVIDGIMLLPLALPPTVVGLFLLLALGRRSFVGHLLGGGLVFTWPAAVVASIVISLPLMYQATKVAFRQVDAALLDLARIDGFSEWRILWQVMVPLAWNGLLAGTALAFVRALGEFGATLMIAGNIPGVTQTVPLAIFFSVETGDRASAVVLSLLSLSLSAGTVALLGFLEKKH